MTDFVLPVLPTETMDAILVVRMTQAERDAVRRVAVRNRCSMSEILRRAVGLYVGDTNGGRGDIAHAMRTLGKTPPMKRAENALIRARVGKAPK